MIRRRGQACFVPFVSTIAMMTENARMVRARTLETRAGSGVRRDAILVFSLFSRGEIKRDRFPAVSPKVEALTNSSTSLSKKAWLVS